MSSFYILHTSLSNTSQKMVLKPIFRGFPWYVGTQVSLSLRVPCPKPSQLRLQGLTLSVACILRTHTHTHPSHFHSGAVAASCMHAGILLYSNLISRLPEGLSHLYFIF